VGSLPILVVGLACFAVALCALHTFVTGHPDLATACTVFCGVFIQAFPFLVLGVVVSGLIAGHGFRRPRP
jgi:uncharacterized protein